MNTRKLLVVGLVLFGLALAVLITNRAAALPQPAWFEVSGSNQIFYSPSVESMVNRERGSLVTNQVFYSPTVASFINRSRTSPIANQIFYSPTIESFIR